MGFKAYPRVIIAGTGGDSGKTIVSAGLLRYYRDMGLKTGAFKKGPDYIDTAWLSHASGETARNLDSYLTAKKKLLNSFLVNGSPTGINIIEGNRGLYDGFDAKGAHSTAELAKLLKAPVIIVLSVPKVTRTAAALVLGLNHMDKKVNIAGIIINDVAGDRHKKIISESIFDKTGIPVIGAIPRFKDNELIPSRHLGLITPGEFDNTEKAIVRAKQIIADYVDTGLILKIANGAAPFEKTNLRTVSTIFQKDKFVKIGYMSDKIFSFYYPENLEALESEGAELIKISSISDKYLPDIDALFIGGGFPESNIESISQNKELMMSLKEEVDKGLPVYAECGGLIYLSESIEINGNNFKLSSILPVKIAMNKSPQGHGYYNAIVDYVNPFFRVGTKLKGHEFHYSKMIEWDDKLGTCFSVLRGKGFFNGRDGLCYKNVLASYLHIHALGCPEWQKGMIAAAKKSKKLKIKN